MLRPIRPNPFIPTLIAILPPEIELYLRFTNKPVFRTKNAAERSSAIHGLLRSTDKRATSPCELKMLWAALRIVNVRREQRFLWQVQVERVNLLGAGISEKQSNTA
jgi:hypothetical protein